jgi:anaerobic selenocysteine-containing dehydrogenase
MRMMNALGSGAWTGGICSSTGEAGYRMVLGEVIGPDIEEAVDADALILWGVDVARTWHHMLPIVKELCARSVPVVAIDVYRSDTVKTAARLPMTDLEDALQVAAALACKAEVIATRKLHDFKRSPVPARSPAAVLDELRQA